MKTRAALVLARMDSVRFPGKALSHLGEKPIIQWCISALTDQDQFEVILATSDRPVDDPLAEWARLRGINVFRGSSDHVAQRIIDCGNAYNLKYFARINGDSPFVIPEMIKMGFSLCQNKGLDFVTNLIPRAFPYGISVEVLNFHTFREIFQDMSLAAHPEHITNYFYKNLQLFKYYCIPYEHGNDHDIRLTIDLPDDLERMEKLLANIPGAPPYSLSEIIKTYKKIFRDQ